MLKVNEREISFIDIYNEKENKVQKFIILTIDKFFADNKVIKDEMQKFVIKKKKIFLLIKNLQLYIRKVVVFKF